MKIKRVFTNRFLFLFLFSFIFCIKLVLAPIETGIIGRDELQEEIPDDVRTAYVERYSLYDLETQKLIGNVVNLKPYSVSDTLDVFKNYELYKVIAGQPIATTSYENEILDFFYKNKLTYGKYLNSRYTFTNELEIASVRKRLIDFDNMLTKFPEFKGYSYLIKDNPAMGTLRVGDLISEDSFTTSTVSLYDAYKEDMFEQPVRNTVIVLRKGKTGIPISGKVPAIRDYVIYNTLGPDNAFIVTRPKTVFRIMAQSSFIHPKSSEITYVRIEEEITPGGLDVMPQALQGVKDMNTGQQIQFTAISEEITQSVNSAHLTAHLGDTLPTYSRRYDPPPPHCK